MLKVMRNCQISGVVAERRGVATATRLPTHKKESRFVSVVFYMAITVNVYGYLCRRDICVVVVVVVGRNLYLGFVRTRPGKAAYTM